MAFWSKKKNIDALKKELEERKVSYKEEYGCITFEMVLNQGAYSIYPYIKIREDIEELSILVNLRKVVNKENIPLAAFNEKSRFFTAKIKDSILVLEYNCFITYDLVSKVMDSILSSLLDLEEDIDKL